MGEPTAATAIESGIGGFMVTGAAEFPKATETAMHNDVLMKNKFFPIADATITIFGINGKTWTQPTIWVNRDQMLALFLG